MAWWVVFHVVAGVLVTGAVVADVAASVVDFLLALLLVLLPNIICIRYMYVGNRLQRSTTLTFHCWQ